MNELVFISRYSIPNRKLNDKKVNGPRSFCWFYALRLG